jgi:hypothetical protein
VALAAFENIPGNQKVDLFMLLGSQVPQEVISNLQQQIANIQRR